MMETDEYEGNSSGIEDFGSQGDTDDLQSQQQLQAIERSISSINENVDYLKDLFVRRLNDDKQKKMLIQTIAEGASFAYVEPFVHDIILILDRMEKSDDEFIRSIYEELYDALNRRGVKQIKVNSEFDPAFYKAVKIIEDSQCGSMHVSGIIRNGYVLSGKVLRPAEVVVTKPIDKKEEL